MADRPTAHPMIEPAPPLEHDGMDRREFLRWMAASGAVVALRGWSCAAPGPSSFRFTADERKTLAALLDAVIPPDDQPGAAAAGGVNYVETLLNAFGFNPPRILAGGPFSGRSGGADNFSSFLPLSRLEELQWRTKIEGSKGIPEREFNGPVTGYHETYVQGLNTAREQSLARYGIPPEELTPNTRIEFLESLPEEFRTLLYEHAVEAMYGDPVYGGNRDMIGWKNIGFPGDRQPIGNSRAEVSEYDPA